MTKVFSALKSDAWRAFTPLAFAYSLQGAHVKRNLAIIMSRIMLGHSTQPYTNDRNYLKIIIGKHQTGDENEKNALWILPTRISSNECSCAFGFV
jgi:hypothetical protein